jgi:hypothetical protein
MGDVVKKIPSLRKGINVIMGDNLFQSLPSRIHELRCEFTIIYN